MNNIKLRLSFDVERLKKYSASGRSLHFGIYWQIDDSEYYPDEVWQDFGIVLIGWWATKSLVLANTTASSELFFMEGPYRIRITHYSEKGLIELRPTRVEIEPVWTTSFSEFNNALISGANTILEELEILDIGHKEQSGLQRLKNLLAML